MIYLCCIFCLRSFDSLTFCVVSIHIILYQKQPLKAIQNGGGTCSVAEPTDKVLPQSCGGATRGICQSKTKPYTCVCINANWTGPHCLNPVAYDDIIWDPIETWRDIGFTGPSLRGGMGILTIISLAGILLVAPMVLKKRKRARDGYRRVRPAQYERAAH